MKKYKPKKLTSLNKCISTTYYTKEGVKRLIDMIKESPYIVEILECGGYKDMTTYRVIKVTIPPLDGACKMENTRDLTYAVEEL